MLFMYIKTQHGEIVRSAAIDHTVLCTNSGIQLLACAGVYRTKNRSQ